MTLNEAIEFLKTYKNPKHCLELGCDRCNDKQMDLCDKKGYAENVISNEIQKLVRIIDQCGDGVMKNTEKLKAQAQNRIEELKKIKKEV